MSGATLNAIATLVFVLFVTGVAVTDVRTRRIPNGLTLGGAVLGLAFSGLSGAGGVVFALQGLAVGLAVGLLLFVMKALGAGDAKFMAAVGAWAGLERFAVAFLAMVGFGAVFALIWAARQRLLRETLQSTVAMTRGFLVAGDRLLPVVGGTAAGRFPYGVGLGLGAIVWWFWAGGTTP